MAAGLTGRTSGPQASWLNSAYSFAVRRRQPLYFIDKDAAPLPSMDSRDFAADVFEFVSGTDTLTTFNRR